MERHPKGFDLGLERIRRLLASLGDPQTRLPPVIHVAGTNGKGSTVSFMRAILEAEGLAAHVHTSPHLVRWHERYRLGRRGEPGRLVDDAVLADAIRRAREANGGEPVTVFEVLSAVAFLLFAEHPADAALIEVGLGGRLDATNVVDHPAATVVTAISLDHQPYLGDRVELIAAEKAGIFKPGSPVVIGPQTDGAALDVLRDKAARTRAAVKVYGEDFLAYAERGRLIYQDEAGLLDLALPRLPGRHQIGNAATAIAALRAAGFKAGSAAIARGLTGAQWPGRLQRITTGPLFEALPPGSELWLDGGHNPGAGAVIAEALAEMEDRTPRPLHLVCGMLSTKEPVGFFRHFQGMARDVQCVPIPTSDAALAPEVLAGAAREAGLRASPAAGVAEALSRVAAGGRTGDAAPRVLVCGSLYLAGEVLRDSDLAPR
ncbi:folylpolyglutamate synthase/dihydrofolate synthase family protein [Aureimonas sp. AU4]|uniref:bifunctional folylpolyglutamate synthase/dihydrofolate synthase n=1 Tax=Aureimonas sp. AU4 TaxID=1638163 RepID=UPI0007830117|nr:folylpolyglutamate synthase/dihydrofolate synthase family protein [Aureimonas sp. AU4]